MAWGYTAQGVVATPQWLQGDLFFVNVHHFDSDSSARTHTHVHTPASGGIGKSTYMLVSDVDQIVAARRSGEQGPKSRTDVEPGHCTLCKVYRACSGKLRGVWTSVGKGIKLSPSGLGRGAKSIVWARG